MKRVACHVFDRHVDDVTFARDERLLAFERVADLSRRTPARTRRSRRGSGPCPSGRAAACSSRDRRSPASRTCRRARSGRRSISRPSPRRRECSGAAELNSSYRPGVRLMRDRSTRVPGAAAGGSPSFGKTVFAPATFTRESQARRGADGFERVDRLPRNVDERSARGRKRRPVLRSRRGPRLRPRRTIHACRDETALDSFVPGAAATYSPVSRPSSTTTSLPVRLACVLCLEVGDLHPRSQSRFGRPAS